MLPAGKGIFDTSESTAQEALGLDYPDVAWLAWRLSSGAELTPRAKAGAQLLGLGEQPTLDDLRWAARGGVSPAVASALSAFTQWLARTWPNLVGHSM